DFSLPGTDAGVATEQMQEYFPAVTQQQENASTSVLVKADDGLANHAQQIDALVEDLKTLPELSDPASIADPVAVAQAQPDLAPQVLGDDGRIGLIQVDQNINLMDLTLDDK